MQYCDGENDGTLIRLDSLEESIPYHRDKIEMCPLAWIDIAQENKDMLSCLKKKEQKHSVEDNNATTESQNCSSDDAKMETPDDDFTVGSYYACSMSHQERYEYIKNRTYSPVKKS